MRNKESKFLSAKLPAWNVSTERDKEGHLAPVNWSLIPGTTTDGAGQCINISKMGE